MIYTRRSPI